MDQAKKPKNLSKEEESELREHYLKLGKALIENDEKNQFWKIIGKVGTFLNKRVRRWGLFRFYD